jgi:uncharacterized protein (DUF1697 family)
MALVAFLRGVNVGGHRTFRPSVVAKELSAFGVVSVGAAGTFVAREPGTRTKFRAALLGRLPFRTEVVICNGADLLRLEARNPFGDEPVQDGVVRFVTVLAKAGAIQVALPVAWPLDGDWLVRVVASEGQFVFGMYRRHMQTIRYLGQVEKLYQGPATTRNWNTIAAVVRILRGDKGRVGAIASRPRPEPSGCPPAPRLRRNLP